jgi:hypothetical protein
MKLFLFTLLVLIGTAVFAQKPKDGTYTYSIAWAEWDSKTLGDVNVKEVGGCSEGPAVIDFKRKMFWSC